MRLIFARRIVNSYQCDPDTVEVPEELEFSFGDMIRYTVTNGKDVVGYYVCPCEDADMDPCKLKALFKEVVL